MNEKPKLNAKQRNEKEKDHQKAVLALLIKDAREAWLTKKDAELFAKTIDEIALNTGLEYMDVSNAIQYLANGSVPLVNKCGKEHFFYKI